MAAAVAGGAASASAGRDQLDVRTCVSGRDAYVAQEAE